MNFEELQKVGAFAIARSRGIDRPSEADEHDFAEDARVSFVAMLSEGLASSDDPRSLKVTSLLAAFTPQGDTK